MYISIDEFGYVSLHNTIPGKEIFHAWDEGVIQYIFQCNPPAQWNGEDWAGINKAPLV